MDVTLEGFRETKWIMVELGMLFLDTEQVLVLPL